MSVVDAVLVRPLPLRDAGRLAMIWLDDHEHGFPRDEMSYARFADTRRLATKLAGVAAFEAHGYVLTGGDEPEDVVGLAASANLFAVLGVPAALGRTFVAGEDAPGGARVVVLSHGLWVRRYGADPGVVGRRILVDSQPYSVIGVMPASFAFPDRRPDLWLPIALTAAERSDRRSITDSAVARLGAGVSPAQAKAELDAINRRLGEQFPATDRRQGTVLTPLRDEMTAPVRGGLLVLAGAVLGVLLVACANVAGLQL